MSFQKKVSTKIIMEERLKEMERQLKELSFSYEKLGKTLMDMPRMQWELTEEEVYSILGRISLEVCGGCAGYGHCYRQGKEETLEVARKLLFYLEHHGTGEKEGLKKIYDKECQRKDAFLEALIQSYEIVGMQRHWKNKMLCQRKMMAVQMKEMGRFLFERASWMERKKEDDKALLGRLRKGLRGEKISLDQVEMLENAGKKKELFLVARKRGKGMRTDFLAGLLGKIINIPLVPGKDCPMWLYQEKTLLHFKEDVAFQMLTGVACRCKDGERESGDIYSIMRLEQGKQVCLLADGMGSGKKARRESQKFMELMEQLLNTGFREEASFRLANGVSTFGMEPSAYTSLDLLSVNLYTGLMKIMKSGSAATFLVRKGQVEILVSGSLPAGFFGEVEFDVIYKKLYDGDRIVLVSDGVLEGMAEETPEIAMKESIFLACQGNPQQAAEEILKIALEKEQNRADDDMTVMVLSIWKK